MRVFEAGAESKLTRLLRRASPRERASECLIDTPPVQKLCAELRQPTESQDFFAAGVIRFMEITTALDTEVPGVVG